MPVDWRAQGNLTNPGLWETEWNKRREHAVSRISESSQILLQQVARPRQTTVEKLSKRWEARHSHWHPVSWQRENTAAENISDLLRDAHQTIRSQYARCLAQNIPKTTDIDVLSVDRSSLFQPDSLLRCLLVTQGSILRDATSAHPLFTSFLILCLLAINDEAQQGGQSSDIPYATCSCTSRTSCTWRLLSQNRPWCRRSFFFAPRC